MKVKELLSDKKRWTQRGLAKNAKGREVHYDDPQAFSFSLLGAILKCYPGDSCVGVIESVFQSCPWIGEMPFESFCSTLTYGEVMKVVKTLDI